MKNDCTILLGAIAFIFLGPQVIFWLMLLRLFFWADKNHFEGGKHA